MRDEKGNLVVNTHNENRVELTSMNVLLSKMNKKKVYIVEIPCKITDRRTGCHCADRMYEFVSKHEDYEIDVAFERMKKKADFLGCEIEILDRDSIFWKTQEICMDSVFDEGDEDD